MNTKELTRIGTCATLSASLLTASLLTASSLAQAHGSGSADSGWYHYLSSPDHVIGFVMLGVVALALAGQLLHRARRDKL